MTEHDAQGLYGIGCTVREAAQLSLRLIGSAPTVSGTIFRRSVSCRGFLGESCPAAHTNRSVARELQVMATARQRSRS
jgi:hypothetical protein